MGALHIPISIFLSALTVILVIFCSYFLYALLQAVFSRKTVDAFRGGLIVCVASSIVTVMLTQLMTTCDVLSMGWLKFFFCALIVATPVGFLYCLSGRLTLSAAIGEGIFMLLSTVNAYVYRFRGRLFEPVDIFSAGTAMNVADNYNLFPLPKYVAFAYAVFVGMLAVVYLSHRKEKLVLVTKKRVISSLVCVALSAVACFYAVSLQTYHWGREGAIINGYVLDFVSKFKEISPSKPEGYSAEIVADAAQKYKTQAESEDGENKPPHIIVIMDEAFSDLGVVGEFSCNTEVTPFISSLGENAITGYALSSVHGGNTANSEYEFLTGNSLAWFSPNCVPYQQYLHTSTYSMVSYLKMSYDYKCIAMHPYLASGWNRPDAYEYLGFDECRFIEDFPCEDYVRSYVSDREMFEYLIDTYESKKDERLFLFGVTMQNHGGYNYDGENYTKNVSLVDGESFPEVEQYLSLIHETDRAVEYLITYFENVDEDVVIVFFGDHQPRLDESFYNSLSGNTGDTLEEKQDRYKVPFFIWANYDIEEGYKECTSLNYLSSYVYDVAGIELAPYNRFLRELESVAPAVNANGYYSLVKDCWLSFDEAVGEEKEKLELYEMFQYNSTFDKKNRSEILFPTLK